ncbi:pirin family protein [Xanthobacter sp. TB0139]|uniref:pirin family protein n=1 Tax=Xanthobacter sp. TB0139 TaxID=3459178 RepID=UPI0040394916
MSQLTFPASQPGVDHVLKPRPRDIGGMRVGRILPSARGEMVGPFIFMDRLGPTLFGPGEAEDVLPHPHIGLATVTYLFDGRMTHRDSLGTAQVIAPGAVNLMSAGRGIVHSERHDGQVRAQGGGLSGVQTWLALPRGTQAGGEESAPTFHHASAEDLPVVEEKGLFARVVLGAAFGVRAPVPLASSTLFVEAWLEAGASLPLETGEEERAVFPFEGEVEVDGVSCAPNTLIVVRQGLATQVRARTPARLLLLGGASMDGPRHIWWNFVSSDPERLKAAAQDWRTRRFPPIPMDHDSFIPAPSDGPGRPRAQKPRAVE